MENAAGLEHRLRRLASVRERFEAALAAAAAAIGRPPGADWAERVRAEARAIEALRPALQAALRDVEELLGARPRRRPARPAPRGRAEATAVALAEAAVIRAALRRWDGVTGQLERAAEGCRRPLYAVLREQDLLPAQLDAIDLAFDVLDKALARTDQDSDARRHGCFPDIRLPPSRFLAHAHAAWRLLAAMGRLPGACFLDVGCGAGSKVLLASQIFDRAEGLEYDPGYAAAARRLLGTFWAPRTAVIEGDALAFDGYGRYDVIYLFAPMSVPEKLRALEDRVALMARPGTVLITPYDDFGLRAREIGAAPVGAALSLARTGPAEAERIRAAAERIGPRMARPRRMRARNEDGLWADLLLALRRAGFAE